MCSAIFAARSNATHAITFDWVKWRCGPRISQMPSSGSCQTRSRCSIIAGSSSPVCGWWAGRCAVAAEPGFDRGERGVGDLPEHVELELLARFVPDAHRLRVLVAGQPVELDLGQPALTADAVHDLEVARIAGDRALQPVLPRGRFVAKPLRTSACSVSDESRSHEKR